LTSVRDFLGLTGSDIDRLKRNGCAHRASDGCGFFGN
jgi:hypothetical protein